MRTNWFHWAWVWAWGLAFNRASSSIAQFMDINIQHYQWITMHQLHTLKCYNTWNNFCVSYEKTNLMIWEEPLYSSNSEFEAEKAGEMRMEEYINDLSLKAEQASSTSHEDELSVEVGDLRCHVEEWGLRVRSVETVRCGRLGVVALRIISVGYLFKCRNQNDAILHLIKIWFWTTKIEADQ